MSFYFIVLCLSSSQNDFLALRCSSSRVMVGGRVEVAGS